MTRFDWHSDPITRDTPIDSGFRTTQRVRRFLAAEAGVESAKIDRAFREWIATAQPTTMGELADKWLRRRA